MRGFVLIVTVGYSLLGVAPAAPAQTAEAGHRDFSYGTGMNEPTADKPQSKLWFNDGTWWGALWSPSARRWEIHRFDWAADSWASTGTPIDARGNTRPDVLWDGSRLYAVTAPNAAGSTDQRALLRRYSYDSTAKKYALDPNFPAAVASGPMETIVLDKDTTGKLWVTFTQGGKVHVNRSLEGDASWGTPFVPAALSGTSVDPDDISSVISFDRKTGTPQIGLMWSNQSEHAMYFATHKDGDPDGVWQPTRLALGGPKYADDHISLKSLEADASGRVFAAVKTGLNDAASPNPDDPLNMLLVLGQQNQWDRHVFGRVRDNHTKPMVSVDQVNRKVYVFATGPTGTIYYKQADLDNISFPVGLGTPFMKGTNTINNVTSTKQNITQASGIGARGLLVVASDNVNRYYWHSTIDTVAPETAIDSGPSGTAGTSSASFAFSSSEAGSAFECSLDGAAFGSCASPKDYTGLSEGSHTFRVRATDQAGNSDATPASRSWTVFAATGRGGDTTAPKVTAVTPENRTTGVSSANPSATFSEAMEASTINATTFSLFRLNPDGTKTRVAAAVGYDPASKKAILNPKDNLRLGATYRAKVGTGAKDLAGNALDENPTKAGNQQKVWTFTTDTS